MELNAEAGEAVCESAELLAQIKVQATIEIASNSAVSLTGLKNGANATQNVVSSCGVEQGYTHSQDSKGSAWSVCIHCPSGVNNVRFGKLN
jgi:hypothetical protein